MNLPKFRKHPSSATVGNALIGGLVAAALSASQGAAGVPSGPGPRPDAASRHNAFGGQIVPGRGAEPGPASLGRWYSTCPPDRCDSPTESTDPVHLSWYWAAFGGWIGAGGMAVADLDADGAEELVASAYLGAGYWYIVEPHDGGYRQRWTSLPLSEEIDHLVVAQLDADEPLEVTLVTRTAIRVIDGRSLALELEFPSPALELSGFAVAQLDEDASPELVLCDSTATWALDLESMSTQWAQPGLGCEGLAVGELDGTPGLEIAVGTWSDGWILDGEAGSVEWSAPIGFQGFLAVGDLDQDGVAELATGSSGSEIRVWNIDTQTVGWDQPIADISALAVADVDGDDGVELVYGDRQYGGIHVLHGVSGEVLWSVTPPEPGVTGIAVGDLDQDGSRELYFGAGFDSSGPDRLYSVLVDTHDVAWRSADVRGPFSGLANGDVDGDGRPELLFTSFESDSGYGSGLFFLYDVFTHELEYESLDPEGSDRNRLHRIATAQLDGDSALEILLPTSENRTGVLKCLDGANLEVQWAAELAPGLTFASLELADLDRDGALDIASAVRVEHTGAPGVYSQLHDAGTGSPLWQSPNLESFFGLGTALDLLRIADVDDDEHEELLVASRGGGLLVLDPVAGTIDLGVDEVEITALESVDLEGDGVPEIVVGTSAGEILRIDASSGGLTTLAGPFGGAIDGLAVVDFLGDETPDFLFAAADRLHLVDGTTPGSAWISADLGSGVGRSDSLRVVDLEGDGDLEIWLNTGRIGHMIFLSSGLPFADGFETTDTTSWSSALAGPAEAAFAGGPVESSRP